jgi:hypothetical protein
MNAVSIHCAGYLTVVLLAGLLTVGCTSGSSRTLKVNPGTVAVQYTPDQVIKLMRSEGYVRVKELDRGIWKEVYEIQTPLYVRMWFAAEDSALFRVDVEVNEDNGRIRLRFREEGSRRLSSEGEMRFRLLKDAFQNQFGSDVVSD